MIQPVLMSCPRDLDLLHLFLRSFRVYRCGCYDPVVTFERHEWPTPAEIVRLHRAGVYQIWERRKGYGQWCWDSSRNMLEVIGKAAQISGVKDHDYLWKVDSDVVLVSDRIFELIDGATDLYGSPHSELTPTPRFGPWGHLSGASIFVRNSIARRIALFTESDFAQVEDEMRKAGLCVNEDVVLTYASQYAGATRTDLHDPAIACTDPEGVLLDGKIGEFSLVHLAGDRTSFGPYPVVGKWAIPLILNHLGWQP